MSACLVVFGLLLGCAGDAPVASAPQEDLWLAEDKIRHFTVSTAATTMGYGAARIALDRDEALLAATATALALGVGKEVVDLRRGGPFSLKDLVWDAAGIAVGVALVHRIR